MQRLNGRLSDQLRPIVITYNAYGYAAGSVLFELGNTKVLCNVSMQQGVPPFMKGKKEGWLTAEYSLLPTSTMIRSTREGQSRRNDRAIEISRLIGRSLRAIVNLSTIGERTIIVDCDVLQADGSTRTAAITGSYIALQQASAKWLASGEIQTPFIIESVAAVSVGWAQEQALLDLDYQEDSTIDSDYNVVLTQSGKIIEIQGTAEKNPLDWDNFQRMMTCARKGINALFDVTDAPRNLNTPKVDNNAKLEKKVPLFSLQARLKPPVIENV